MQVPILHRLPQYTYHYHVHLSHTQYCEMVRRSLFRSLSRSRAFASPPHAPLHGAAPVPMDDAPSSPTATSLGDATLSSLAASGDGHAADGGSGSGSLGPAAQAHGQEGSSTSVGSRQAQAPAVAEPCRRRLVAAHSLGAAVVVFLAASGRVAARDATAARRVIVVSRAAASARDADACAASIARHVPGGCKHDSIIACCAEGIAQGVAVAIAIAVAR